MADQLDLDDKVVLQAEGGNVAFTVIAIADGDNNKKFTILINDKDEYVVADMQGNPIRDYEYAQKVMDSISTLAEQLTEKEHDNG